MNTEHETQYRELTHQLANAARAVGGATGILPIALPMGHSPGGGGAGANAITVGRLIWTLERFAEDVHRLIEDIERYHARVPDPIGPNADGDQAP